MSNLRLDLRNGQQCVRDFFICLNENLLDWPDVYSTFSFTLTHSTECSSCTHRNVSETNQLYIEMPVPPSNSDLKGYIEDFLNEGSELEYQCQEGCNDLTKKIKQTSITNLEEAKFITIILTRGIETMDGFRLVNNKIKSTDNVNIRYIYTLSNNKFI